MPWAFNVTDVTENHCWVVILNSTVSIAEEPDGIVKANNWRTSEVAESVDY